MIAEIHSKISSTGSNISDRSEDQLTGNVFGTLRYLPFELGLKQVLLRVRYETPSLDSSFQEAVKAIRDGSWSKWCKFWPAHPLGEIDVMFAFPNLVIGLEVKYHSGLSSDDGIDNSQVEGKEFSLSKNQLAREVEIVQDEMRVGGRAGWLILLALQGQGEPIVASVRERKILGEIPLGILSWTSVLDAVVEARSGCADQFHQLILEDLIELLKKKGFERFQHFPEPEPMQIDRTVVFNYHPAFVTYSFEYPKTIDRNGFFNYSK